MSAYKWKTGVHFKVDAQTTGEELERLAAFSDGKLTAEGLVDAARDEGSVLHPAFEWDDAIASEKWRQTQARKLLSGIRLIRADRGKPVLSVAFVSVSDPNLGRGYQSVAKVMTDEDLRLRLLLEAKEQMEGFMRRYGHLQELAEVFTAIAKVS